MEREHIKKSETKSITSLTSSTGTEESNCLSQYEKIQLKINWVTFPFISADVHGL